MWFENFHMTKTLTLQKKYTTHTILRLDHMKPQRNILPFILTYIFWSFHKLCIKSELSTSIILLLSIKMLWEQRCVNLKIWGFFRNLNIPHFYGEMTSSFNKCQKVKNNHNRKSSESNDSDSASKQFVQVCWIYCRDSFNN